MFVSFVSFIPVHFILVLFFCILFDIKHPLIIVNRHLITVSCTLAMFEYVSPSISSFLIALFITTMMAWYNYHLVDMASSFLLYPTSFCISLVVAVVILLLPLLYCFCLVVVKLSITLFGLLPQTMTLLFFTTLYYACVFITKSTFSVDTNNTRCLLTVFCDSSMLITLLFYGATKSFHKYVKKPYLYEQK